MNNNIEKLKKDIIEFMNKRDWKQFHRIKDLLIGLNIEVSELQELFLWKDKQEIQAINKNKLEDEIADIFIFLIYICEDLNVDLYSAVKLKLKKNEKKYPVDKSKGSNKKYNEF